MLDVAVAYSRYKFLGDEFLTWLWYVIATRHEKIEPPDQDPVALEIGNRMVLENRRGSADETITIKGDDAGLEEGLLALKKGALITELNLVFRSAEHKWQFSLKGESLNISALKTPDIARPEDKDDVEGFVLEKIYLYDKIVRFLDVLFERFIRLRISDGWDSDVLPNIKNWISTGV